MTKYTLLAAAIIAILPAAAFADRYDRGDRYRHYDRSRSRSAYSVNVAFGSIGYRDFSHVSFGYSRGSVHRPVVYAPPPRVIYRPAVYAPRPVVYAPPHVVYYAPPPPIYYRPVYYYDSGYCGW